MDRYFELSESETFKMVCPFPVSMECAGRSANDFPMFVGVV